MAEIVQDPIEGVMNCDQYLVYDSTYIESKLIEETTTAIGQDALYQSRQIRATLPSFTHMDYLVLSIPMVIRQYLPTGSAGPYSQQYDNLMMADMGIMNAFWTIMTTLNNQNIAKEEDNKLRNLKLTMVDYKYDDDDYRILGNWGLPITQTFNYTNENEECMSFSLNPPVWRETFVRLMRSADSELNGVVTQQTIQTQVFDVYTLRATLPLPLKYIYRQFRARGRLPTGLEIITRIQAYINEQVFAVFPGRQGYITTQCDVSASNNIKFYYVYDYVKQGVEQMLKEFRLSRPMVYVNELTEEYVMSNNGSSIYFQNITIQQQMPNEFIIRFLSQETGGTQADTNVAPYYISSNSAYFANSNVSISTNGLVDAYTPNSINQIDFFNSGKLIYSYIPNQITSSGSVHISAQDYIFGVMQKQSNLSLNLGHISKPTNFLNGGLIAGPISFIYRPGGEANIGVQHGDLKAYNIRVSIVLAKPLNPNFYISVTRKIPAMLTIDALNKVHQQMWPQLEKDNVIQIVQPTLSS